ncbi:hypothetical protein KVT40_004604 [Elsinoe batatas]|uniref:Calcineurin-like phosphoesterase domain-containing protein n=1 Tax=Elsinoe batatas TaxID=2601811 RepID=A0A8K0PEU1_9PEZI|nr:hypothetical protein KVT40_004604 [Elsinoe batatas]
MRYHRHRIHSESDARHEPEASEPLISRVTNAWEDEKSPYASDDEDAQYPPVCNLETISPRRTFRRIWSRTKWLRRILFVYVLLYLLVRHVCRSSILPWIEEDRLFRPGLDKAYAGYGNQAPTYLKGVTQVGHINPEVLPGGPADTKGDKRLIFIGDIHGCLKEFNKLLDAVHFHPSRDHIIHTGDVIAKGPHSAGVIDKLIALNASGVRGNWEDRLLTSTRASISSSDLRTINKPKYDPALHTVIAPNGVSPSQVPHFHQRRDLHPTSLQHQLHLKPHHIRYLSSLPLILTLPPLSSPSTLFSPSLPPSTLFTNLTTTSHRIRLPHLHSPGGLHVVHAGLTPALPLSRQDPLALTTMRFLSPSTHVPFPRRPKPRHPGAAREKVVRWTRAWNWYQRRLAKGVRKPRVADLAAGDTKGGVRAQTGHEVYRLLPSGPEGKFTVDARGVVEVLNAVGLAGWGRRVEGWFGIDQPSSTVSPLVSGGSKGRVVGGGFSEGERMQVERESEEARRKEKASTVVYGHNSKDGVRVERWSVGLDGGCVRGGRLVGMTLDARGRRELVSVACGRYD